MVDPEGWRRLVEDRSGPVETVIRETLAAYGQQCETGPPTGAKWRGKAEMIADALRAAGLIAEGHPPSPLDLLDGATVLGQVIRNVMVRLGHNPEDPEVIGAVRFAVRTVTRIGEGDGSTQGQASGGPADPGRAEGHPH